MSEIVFEVAEAREGGYTARAVGHSIFTEADTFEELGAMAHDAVRTHLATTGVGQSPSAYGTPRVFLASSPTRGRGSSRGCGD